MAMASASRPELCRACDELVRLAGALRVLAASREDASGRCVAAAAQAAAQAAAALAPWEATLAALPKGAPEPEPEPEREAEGGGASPAASEADSEARAFAEAEAAAATELTPEGGAAAALSVALRGASLAGGVGAGAEAVAEASTPATVRPNARRQSSISTGGSSACFDAPTPTLEMMATPGTVARVSKVAGAGEGDSLVSSVPSANSDELFRSPLGTPLAARLISPPTTVARLRPDDLHNARPSPRSAAKGFAEADKENEDTMELRASLLGMRA